MSIIRGKTHEQFVEELHDLHPNIEPLTRYTRANDKMSFRCKIDGCVWTTTPGSILYGSGCPECGNQSTAKKLKKTPEEYAQELGETNPNIIVLEKYVNAKTPIKHKCLIDGYEWLAAPSNILAGHGCPKCANSVRKTHEQYVEEVHNISPQIDVLGRFVNAKTKILHRCNTHGIEWYAHPGNILRGCGCKKCGNQKASNAKSLTQEEYVRKVSDVNPNIEVVGRYVNAKTRILHYCKTHDISWYTSPDSILQGCGCSKCNGEKISNALSWTHDEYLAELKRVHKNIIPIQRYLGANEPITHKCIKCGNIWDTRPANLLSGFGCSKCNESHGERLVSLWLDEHDINYKRQYRFDGCKDVKRLPFDFYLPDLNVCIEFDGIQHRRPVDRFGGEEAFEILSRHDKIKDEYCNKNNIRLIRLQNINHINKDLNNFLLA